MLPRSAPLHRSPMKPYRRKAPTAAERRHLDRVAQMGCLVCGQPSTVHHVTSDGYQRLTRTHARIVPLCPQHHMIQFGAIAGETKHLSAWARQFGIRPETAWARIKNGWEPAKAVSAPLVSRKGVKRGEKLRDHVGARHDVRWSQEPVAA